MSRVDPDHEGDHEGEGLTIAAAAHRLGVSENAVRQRIKRESIQAHKIEGVWRVWLPIEADHESDYHADHQTDQEASSRDKPSNQEADRQATTSAAAVENIPALIGQFEAIRDQWLRPFVDDLNAKSERIGQLQERLVITEERLTVAERERDELRRRLEESRTPPESPQTHDVAPGAAQGGGIHIESNSEPEKAGRGGFGGLWDWLRGK